MDRILNIVGEAEYAYIIKYYRTESCTELSKDVILAMGIIEATEIAVSMAASEFHVISIKDIGMAHIKEGSLIRAGKWADSLKKE